MPSWITAFLDWLLGRTAAAQTDTAAPEFLVPAQADRLISENLRCLPIESLPLVQCADAILRENPEVGAYNQTI